jgi:hypothetical protein
MTLNNGSDGVVMIFQNNGSCLTHRTHSGSMMQSVKKLSFLFKIKLSFSQSLFASYFECKR